MSLVTSMLNTLTPAFKFTVVNLGCKVNRVESDTIMARLLADGGVCTNENDADLVIVNSCTVTAEADKKTRKAVRGALRTHPRARIVVTGCGVSVDAQMFREIDERVETIERTELMMQLNNHLRMNSENALLRIGDGFRTRVNVKIQDGCDHACTYCIVHVARGPAQSVPFSEVLEEVDAYLARGAKEIVLTGIDLGSYRDGTRRLTNLASEILERADKRAQAGERPARVRASSVEPTSIDESFIDLLASAEGRLCRHLHLPLQSGSTRVLQEMARPYTSEDFVRLVDELYRRIPQFSLTTDIICGFPGEADEDFAQTLELARRARFSKIHVFPYSKRTGTPAAARSNQVSEEIKARRTATLRELAENLRMQDFAHRTGTTELAIIEPDCALTESYHELARPAASKVGELVPMTIN